MIRAFQKMNTKPKDLAPFAPQIDIAIKVIDDLLKA
jgi:hypothetical protein